MKLNLDASCVWNGPTLSLEPTPCFLLPITIKGGKSMIVRIQPLLNSRAFACFIDNKLVWQHNLVLVKKAILVTIKVIDGQNLSSRPVTHETKTLMVTIGSHNSKLSSMLFHLQQTLSSLGYHGLFCIIFEWIGRRKIFILNQ